jgi:rRNA maturation protein Nop10
MKWLRFCRQGGHYTLLESCHSAQSSNPHPAKFNPLEIHSAYRRMLKGLL